jgi:nucleoside-diphosphate-sugar epimerase
MLTDMRMQDQHLPPGAKVIVTGANGFIGRSLALRLSQMPGVEVRCLVRSKKSAKAIRGLKVDVRQVSFEDGSDLQEVASGVTYVFHCAYDAMNQQSNLHMFDKLLEACAVERVESLVLLSSFAAYQPFTGLSVSEADPDGDRSIEYVDVKLKLEKMALDVAGSGRLRASILQPSIVYGSHCGVWTRQPAEQLLSGQFILPDISPSICNLVHVDDLVNAMLLAAREEQTSGQRYIVSGPEPVSWRDFYGAIASVLGAQPPILWSREKIVEERHRTSRRRENRFARLLSRAARFRLVALALRAARRLTLSRSGISSSRPIILPDQALMNMYECGAVASIEKAKREFGYQPTVDLAEGIKRSTEYLVAIAAGKLPR